MIQGIILCFLIVLKKKRGMFFSKSGSYLGIHTYKLVIYMYIHTYTYIYTQQQKVASDPFNCQAGHSVNPKGWEERTWSRNVKLSVHAMINWKSNQSNISFFFFFSYPCSKWLFKMNTECLKMSLLEHQMPGNAVVFCFHHFIPSVPKYKWQTATGTWESVKTHWKYWSDVDKCKQPAWRNTTFI